MSGWTIALIIVLILILTPLVFWGVIAFGVAHSLEEAAEDDDNNNWDDFRGRRGRRGRRGGWGRRGWRRPWGGPYGPYRGWRGAGWYWRWLPRYGDFWNAGYYGRPAPNLWTCTKDLGCVRSSAGEYGSLAGCQQYCNAAA